MPIDPDLNTQENNQALDAQLEFLDGLEEQQEATTAAQQEYEAVEEQATAEQEDPREADKWGFKH